MEPVEVAATTEAAEPAAPKKTDLEKYLLLAQEPMNTDVLASMVHGGSCAITTRLRTPRPAALRGCLTSLAWYASGWARRLRAGHVGWF